MKSVVLYVIDSNGKIVPFVNTTEVNTINAVGDTINPSTEEKQDAMITELQRLDTSNIDGVVAIIGNDSIEENYTIDAPAASTDYTQALSLDGYGSGKIFIKADQPIDVTLQISFDNGVTWDDIGTPKIANADFSITDVNVIDVKNLMAFRIKFLTGATAPTDIKYKFIRNVI